MDILELGQCLKIDCDWTVIVEENNHLNESLDNMDHEELNNFMFENSISVEDEVEFECATLEASIHNLSIESIQSPFPKKS